MAQAPTKYEAISSQKALGLEVLATSGPCADEVIE
jgi:hypothetical protein